jgi:hypothetical protein
LGLRKVSYREGVVEGIGQPQELSQGLMYRYSGRLAAADAGTPLPVWIWSPRTIGAINTSLPLGVVYEVDSAPLQWAGNNDGRLPDQPPRLRA